MNKQQTDNQEAGVCQSILSMEGPCIIPHPLLETLGVAIALDTKEPTAISLSEIKLYKLYDPKDNSFLGSFYAIFRNDKYYGNVVGTERIISCTDKNVRLEESDELFVPLLRNNKLWYTLECRYDTKTGDLTGLHLQKMSEYGKQTEIIHSFSKEMDISDVFEKSYQIIDDILSKKRR